MQRHVNQCWALLINDDRRDDSTDPWPGDRLRNRDRQLASSSAGDGSTPWPGDRVRDRDRQLASSSAGDGSTPWPGDRVRERQQLR